MCNDEIGEIQVFLEILKEIKDLRPYRHIKGRHRLIT